MVRSPSTSADETLVLQVVHDLIRELRPDAPDVTVRPDSQLDAELGLDSLAVVELRARLERAFGVELPDSLLSDGATPADWVRGVVTRPARRGATVFPPPVTRRVTPAGRVSSPPAGELPTTAGTLVEVVRRHVATHGEQVHLVVVDPDQGPAPVPVTYRSLSDAADAVAAGLRDRGIRPGERVAIMLPTTRDYFDAFVGVLVAGAVPVPIYPPGRPAALEEHLERQVGILDAAGVAVLIGDMRTLPLARLVHPHVPTLRGVWGVAELRQPPALGTARPVVGPHDTALLQYTSGSTGHPKGVVLSHAQLLANIAAMVSAARVGPSDVFVSWLPLYHDMGLVSWLASLTVGFPFVVMPPTAFLGRPARWLRTISEYGATLSGGPNFGYELCLRHVTDDQLEGVDLSSWRMALNGAEPVSARTVERFTDRFAPFGFRPSAMAPVYGLAEVGVGLCFPPPDRAPVVDEIDRDVFTRRGRAVPAGEGRPRLRFVSCGQPLPGYQVRVVDAGGLEVADRHEGRIECTGPSATAGYFGDAAASAALYHGRWLDTGDLGYVADGDVYVTGRVKDIIIRAGRNIHPEELEVAVGSLPGVRTGCVVAFPSADPTLGTERLVVVAETRVEGEARAELRRAVVATTVDVLGTPADDVVLAPPGTILKTSSGKVRRAACRQRYEAGRLGQRPRRSGLQVAHFALTGIGGRVRRVRRFVSGLLYALWVWSVLLVVGVPTWLVVATVPSRRTRWWAVRVAGRAVGRLAGVPIAVAGGVDRTRPAVLIANHGSFIDGLVVAVAAGGPVTFVAGDELASQRIAGPFLRRLGCEFVHRSDRRLMAADAARLAARLGLASPAAGPSPLVFFPEGGLDRAVGIRPFHLGAFSTACSAGVDVVPVGIRGSRGVVRPGSKLPRRGAVSVTIGEPLHPAGSDWQAVLALRDDARGAVSALAGEPVLASGS